MHRWTSRASTDCRRTSVATEPLQTEDGLDPDVMRELSRQLRGLRFGSVEIIVHDGAITQIERREKVRLTAQTRTQRE
ncbi:MAG: YezD family protein [Burkholderiales bacterium]|nr:YezD family protein [Burkholderiales bacterium]